MLSPNELIRTEIFTIREYINLLNRTDISHAYDDRDRIPYISRPAVLNRIRAVDPPIYDWIENSRPTFPPALLYRMQNTSFVLDAIEMMNSFNFDSLISQVYDSINDLYQLIGRHLRFRDWAAADILMKWFRLKGLNPPPLSGHLLDLRTQYQQWYRSLENFYIEIEDMYQGRYGPPYLRVPTEYLRKIKSFYTRFIQFLPNLETSRLEITELNYKSIDDYIYNLFLMQVPVDYNQRFRSPEHIQVITDPTRIGEINNAYQRSQIENYRLFGTLPEKTLLYRLQKTYNTLSLLSIIDRFLDRYDNHQNVNINETSLSIQGGLYRQVRFRDWESKNLIDEWRYNSFPMPVPLDQGHLNWREILLNWAYILQVLDSKLAKNPRDIVIKDEFRTSLLLLKDFLRSSRHTQV